VQASNGTGCVLAARRGWPRTRQGNTAGSMGFVWRDPVFTGDTLLINGCGRTDFQSGSASALCYSITRVLLALAESTTV